MIPNVFGRSSSSGMGSSFGSPPFILLKKKPGNQALLGFCVGGWLVPVEGDEQSIRLSGRLIAKEVAAAGDKVFEIR